MKTLPGFPLQLIFFELEDEAICDSQTQQESQKSLHFAGGFDSASRDLISEQCIVFVPFPVRQWRNMSYKTKLEELWKTKDHKTLSLVAHHEKNLTAN